VKCPERSTDEAGRLAALAEYGIDDREGLPSLGPIVEMAVHMFGCPAAAVNMIGADHVFLAANEGIGEFDPSRDVSFCAHAINEAGVLVVEDAALDPRFHDNPLVTEGLIRFYAGVALKSPSGHALGALCVLDPEPRAGFALADRMRLRELASLVSDKLELRRLELQAASKPSRFAASAATSPNAVICFDASARITAWNAAAAEMFGYSAELMIGETIDRIIDASDHPLVHAAVERVRGGGTPVTEATSLTGVRASGERFPGEIHWSHWFEGGAMQFGTIVRDMTDARAEHDELYRLANFDSLTGLPNRNLLLSRMREAAAADIPHAILIADLGGFADINNTLGHAAGDTLLTMIGTRLLQLVAEPDMAARIGGAAFALLVTERDPLALDILAGRLLAAIGERAVVNGQEVRLTSNIGIAIAPEHGATDVELIGSAELALFQARQRGLGTSCQFVPAFRAEAVARRMYDAELHRAHERSEFCLLYQPQMRLADGALVGAEALIR
jgi:diguanylate cyclase (GGDEF)-like protein/PAS domain S-box-containing protein